MAPPDMRPPEEGEPELRSRFGPVEIAYDRRVLEPRPWTIAQSEWAAELAADAPPGPLLEMCAGAGQIGLAAAMLSGRSLVQVDADAVAVDYARANAERSGVADRVEVRHGRLDAVLAPDERFAVVVADPPYVVRREIGRFPEDPRTAIDGGADGLDLVRVCLVTGAAHLAEGGAVVLQVGGQAQAEQVVGLLDPARGLAALVTHETRGFGPDRALMLLRAG